MHLDALGTPHAAPTVPGMSDDAPTLDDAALAALLGVSLPDPAEAEDVQAAELAAAVGVDQDDVRPLDHADAESWCEHPRVMRATTATGETGLYAIACGARLAEDCPHCAARYGHRFRRMARQNLGLPDDPHTPPPDGFFLFVTLTHGSCGSVWNAAEIKRRRGGADAGQWLGVPCDPIRYGYAAQILRHMVEPMLRKAWSQAQRRWAARWADAGYDVQSIAVREVQERGAGHLHEIVRVHPCPVEDRGPHAGYWREGSKTKVTPGVTPGSFRHPSRGLITADPTGDARRWVVHSATGTPTAVIWRGTGAAHWYQPLVPCPRTDREVRESYIHIVDIPAHGTGIPARLVEYVGSEAHLALRDRLGLPGWDKTGLTDKTPAQGQIPAIRDKEGVLHPRVAWGVETEIHSISGGEGGPRRVLAYLTKMLSYVAKDVGAASGEGARPGSARGRHDRRMRLEALAMAPVIIDDAWDRMDTDALVARESGLDREHAWLDAGLPMPADDPRPTGRIADIAARRVVLRRALALTITPTHRDQLVEWLTSPRGDVDRDDVTPAAEVLSRARHIPWSQVRDALSVMSWVSEDDHDRARALGLPDLPTVLLAARRAATRAVGTAARWAGYRGRAWTAQGRTYTIADVRAAQADYAECCLAEQGLMPDPTPVQWHTVPRADLAGVDAQTLPRGRAPVPA